MRQAIVSCVIPSSMKNDYYQCPVCGKTTNYPTEHVHTWKGWDYVAKFILILEEQHEDFSTPQTQEVQSNS